jgi:hypothetical protein
MRHAQQECATLCHHWSYFFANKPYFRVGHARQHFPRSHRIKGGYAWIKKKCYLKRLFFVIHIVMV